MKNILLLLILPMLLPASGTLQFTPKNLVEIKVLPKDDAETVQMIKAGERVSIRSALTDTLNRDWYMVVLQGGSVGGFVLAAELEPADDGDKGGASISLKKEEITEKKRRLAEVKAHPEWPRRIQSAVRNGSVCLKMTSEHIRASWKEPYQTTKGFILGFGDVTICFYRSENPIAVVLKNDEVIGWSEKE